MKSLFLAAGLLVLLACGVGSVAHAQQAESSAAPVGGEPAGYRQRVADALSEYEGAHFEEARALMLRAHAEFPNARTWRGLGMISFELREYDVSVRQLEAALKSQVRPLEGELRTETEQLLERARTFVGRLTLEVTPGSARLLLDGVELASTGARDLWLPVGEHEVEVRASGYLSERRTLHVAGGGHETLRIALAPLPEAPLGQLERRPWYRNPWLWISAGVVVAAGAATVTAWQLTRDPPQADPYRGLSGEPPLMGPSQ